MEEAAFSFNYSFPKKGQFDKSHMFTVRAETFDELEQRLSEAFGDAYLEKFLATLRVTATFDATPELPVTPAQTETTSRTDVALCKVCGQPKTRWVTPRQGQTWKAFQACENRDHRG